MTLTRDEILYASERSSGFKTIVQFTNDVEVGSKPDSEVLKEIARAFRVLFECPENLAFSLSLFADELQLSGKLSSGRKTTTLKESESRISATCDYLWLKKSHSETEAVHETAEKYGVSISTIRAWAKEWKGVVENMQKMSKQLESSFNKRKENTNK